nr:MAG TPA: hypothetical protein [Caudoviricetes sp.]
MLFLRFSDYLSEKSRGLYKNKCAIFQIHL